MALRCSILLSVVVLLAPLPSAALAAEPPALAGVYSMATTDSYLYSATDPWGTQIYGMRTTGGWASSAELAVSNPSVYDHQGQWRWDVAGTYSAQSATGVGVNRALARAEAGQATLEGQPQVLAAGLSLWFDRITVTGGVGSGTLAFTARLDGRFDIRGTPTSEGRVGTGGAWLNYLTTTAWPPDLLNGRNAFDQGLAFPCAVGDADCDHDPAIFNSVGSIGAEVGSSTAIDQPHTFNVDFEYGVPFYLIGVLETNAVTFGADAVVESDFMNTARFTAVIAPPGSAVFVGSGEYGAYVLANPVPEPGIWMLMSLGMGGMVAWRRRTRTP